MYKVMVGVNIHKIPTVILLTIMNVLYRWLHKASPKSALSSKRHATWSSYD